MKKLIRDGLFDAVISEAVRSEVGRQLATLTLQSANAEKDQAESTGLGSAKVRDLTTSPQSEEEVARLTTPVARLQDGGSEK